MKILPAKGKNLKLFLLSLAIAFVLNIGELFKIESGAKFVAYLIDTLIYTVLIMVVLRVVDWVLTKIKK